MLADSSAPELFCHRLEMLSELCGQTGKVVEINIHNLIYLYMRVFRLNLLNITKSSTCVIPFCNMQLNEVLNETT